MRKSDRSQDRARENRTGIRRPELDLSRGKTRAGAGNIAREKQFTSENETHAEIRSPTAEAVLTDHENDD
jgi:hypothetical protein